jgi:hypothetical protein
MDPDQIKDVAGKTCRYRGERPSALKAVGQFAETWQWGCCGSLLRVGRSIQQARNSVVHKPIKSRPAEYDGKGPTTIIERLSGLVASVREQRSNRAIKNSPSEHYPEYVMVAGVG